MYKIEDEKVTFHATTIQPVVTLSGVDIESFKQLDHGVGYLYAKDKNTLYENGIVLDFVDVTTFEILNDFYARDRNHVYHGEFSDNFGNVMAPEMRITDMNPKNFKVLYTCDPIYSYVMDGDKKIYFNNYFDRNEIVGVDIESFEILEGRYSKDKNSVYYDAQKIKGAIPESFVATEYEIGFDEKNAYSFGKITDSEKAKAKAEKTAKESAERQKVLDQIMLQRFGVTREQIEAQKLENSKKGKTKVSYTIE